MPLKLIAPGKRKGNKFWLIRGTLPNGERVEHSTKTTDRARALEALRALERDEAKPRSERRTFEEVARMWERLRPRSKTDARWVGLLCERFRGRLLDEVRPADIHAAANELLPEASAATRNRQVITIAAAILHYGAENEWCAYRKVGKLPTTPPEPRQFGAERMRRLIAASQDEPDLWRLLTFLAHQGWRIGEALELRWRQVDFLASELSAWIPKTRAWKRVPMHEATRTALQTVAHARRLPETRVFPFASRWAVYRAVEPLCERLGLRWTPHMARHDFATSLDALDVTPARIAKAGTWLSAATVQKCYTHPGAREARAAIDRLPDLAGRGEKPGETSKK